MTNYPGRKVKGQISTIIGYPFKEGSTVKLSIDDKDFTLYPVGDTAWAEKDDADIVAAMKDGTSLKVGAPPGRAPKRRIPIPRRVFLRCDRRDRQRLQVS